ncbi:MAG: aldo/keto reductase [Firmicutes bacterium]|nr:aldo/keto reductase [Bacillota bacterium]
MDYVKLNTGATMPMLGFGVFNITEDKSPILSALEAGYRSIDTAFCYGNEDLVGKAVQESGLKREDLFITTKLWNTGQREGKIEEEFEQSLKNLGMDYVDLYLVHWPVKECYVDSWLVMEKIYKTGRAKAIGVSNWQSHHVAAAKKVWSVVPAVNQVELHPYLSQKPLLEMCKAEGIIPQAWSPLGGGRVMDVKENLLTNDVLVEIANKYGKSTAQVILRWNIDLGIVTIPKSVTPSRIQANFDIFDFKLTPEEIAAIDGLNKDQRVGPDPDNFEF